MGESGTIAIAHIGWLRRCGHNQKWLLSDEVAPKGPSETTLPGVAIRIYNNANKERLGGKTVSELYRTVNSSRRFCYDSLYGGLKLSVDVSTNYLRPDYKQKSGRPKKDDHSCVGKLFKGLALQEASRHTKRTEGRTEQHYCGAAVGNARNARAKERPARKAVILSG